MGSIEISHLSKRFGATQVLNDLSLSIAHGEFFFILGPSGCGKSTLLRSIAGLEHQDSGTILLDGASLDGVPAHQRGIGMVFQQYALWPHMTVERNVAFGLEARGMGAAERSQRVKSALEMVRLEGYGRRYPNELSGGQQQRVALARALVIEPRIILLDEPLSNLDARLRDEIREELARLHSALGVTMVYVTHDQEDALALASRMAIINSGKVAQIGSPEDVYRRPSSQFVAQFLGDANLIPASLLNAGSSTLCVRPESMRVWTQAPTGDTIRSLKGSVEKLTFKGAYVETRVRISAQVTVVAHTQTSMTNSSELGAQVFVAWSQSEETPLLEVTHE